MARYTKKNKDVDPEPEPEVVKGKKAKRKIKLVPIDLWSLNVCLGGGFPIRSHMEISGPSQSGKSTLGYYIAGALAKPKNKIILCDFETEDDMYPQALAARAGWKGEVETIETINAKGAPLAHEDMLDNTYDIFRDDDQIGVVMVDSMGAISTIAEIEGSVKDANMGARARVIRRFLAKMSKCLRDSKQDSFTIYTNHVHANLGKQGTSTSGGVGMEYYPAVRMKMWTDKEDTLWTIKGTIFKRRYINDPHLPNDFQAILIPGRGIHPGMSAVNDCVLTGLATRGQTVKLGGKSYSAFPKMVDRLDDRDFFEPFVQALKKVKV